MIFVHVNVGEEIIIARLLGRGINIKEPILPSPSNSSYNSFRSVSRTMLTPYARRKTADPDRDLSNWKYLLSRHCGRFDDRTVLDVGCGNGQLVKELSDCAFIIGVDSSPSFSQTQGNFVLGDCHKMPFNDGSFDLVTSIGTLEHVRDYEISLNEMLRVLRPGGFMLISCGPTRLWGIFDGWGILGGPSHRSIVIRYPDPRIIHRILGKGIKNVWWDNVDFKLMHTNFWDLPFIVKRTIAKIAWVLEKIGLEQRVCIAYQKPP